MAVSVLHTDEMAENHKAGVNTSDMTHLSLQNKALFLPDIWLFTIFPLRETHEGLL